MKNISLFLTALLVFALMSSVKISKTPSPHLESSTEFLGFLENGQYCYFRNTIINEGQYYGDKRCKEFIVRKTNGRIVRYDTLWTEETAPISSDKYNSTGLKKYKSNFNILKYLADNKVSTREFWSYLNVYDKTTKGYKTCSLRFLNGNLYLHADKDIFQGTKDSILVYSETESIKNVVAHLDNFLAEYGNHYRVWQQEKPRTKNELVNDYFYNTGVWNIYYYKKTFLVHVKKVSDKNSDSTVDFDTYFTIPEDILEKALEELLKK